MRRAMLAVALGTIACSSDHMGTGPVATRLVFSGQPSAATAGVIITPAIQVSALDDAGVVVTSFNGTITIALAANPGSATLSGTLTRGAIAGVATFSDLRLNKTGNGYALTASSGSLTTATSGGFTIAAAPPQQLAFSAQPTDVVAGVAIAPIVQVQARDSLGNFTPSFTGSVTVTLSPNGAGAVLGGSTTISAVSGVAAFPGLHVDRSGGPFTIQVSAGSLTPATSSGFTVAPAAASALAFTAQPSAAAAGAAIAPPVQVSALDAFGNTTTAFTGNVTLAIGANPGNAVLSGTNLVAAVAGVASFADVRLSKTGAGYTLVANATGLTNATSAAFSINPGGVSASQSGVVAVPATITASSGSSASTITVTVRDTLGNPIQGATAVLSATGSGNTVTQPAGPTDASGVTTGHLSSTAVGAKIVSATIGIVAVAQTDTVTVTPAAAASLGLTVQPVTTVATSAITPAPQVTATDAFGNVATGFGGTITLAIGVNPGGGTLSGTTTVAASGGVATFPGLKIDKAGAGYTLVASSGALAQGTSQTFSITVGPAAKLAFAVQPSGTQAGVSITPAVQVAVQDAGGNLVTGATNSITVSIGTNPSGGTLSGTATVSAAGGVAQFANLSIDKAGSGYTLQAAATGLTTAVSNAFNIASGAADHLAFFVQPVDAAAGAAFTPAMQVEVQDAIGNRVTSSAASVTVVILDNPNNGVLAGTTTLSAVAGVATFSTLSINRSGTGYSLTAAATGLTSGISNDFNITPGAAARVSYFIEPTTTAAGAAIVPAVQAEIQDAFGNRVATATNSVTVALAANPNGGNLSGIKTRSAVAGVATFNNLSIDVAGGGYTMRASASGLIPDTSAAFAIVAGTASQLVFTGQPFNAVATAAITPAVQVTARDGQGNIATGFSGMVTIAIANNAGGGTLAGMTSTAASAGVATFSNLSIDKVGTAYTLSANASGLPQATSGAFNITAGSATSLAFLVQPSGTSGGATLAEVQVEIRDVAGNRVTTAGNSITLAIGTNANGGTLSGTTPKSAVAGLAKFSDLSIDSAGVGYTLSASATSLAGATSTPFTITVGSAAKVGFLVPPSNTVPGAAITPDIQVEVRDLGGNRVTSSSATVSLTFGSNPGGSTLSGPTSLPASSGLATFSGVSINNAGQSYTLVASATSLTSATSPPFNISIGSATKLAFIVAPSSTTGGAAFNPAIQVEIEDVGGNRVTTATNSITLEVANNPNAGTLFGTKTVAAVAGVATFNGVSIDSAGAGYTLNATASGLTQATSSSFNITVGAPAKLGFRVPPLNSTGGVAISPSIQVEVQDAGGNRVTGAGNTVTMSIATNPKSGTLSGTTAVGATNGIAPFSNLSIDSAANGYRLAAAATGLTGATSPTFNISVGPATQLGYFVQPSDVTAGTFITPAVKVEIRDAGGNRVTTASNSVAVAIGTNPGGGTLSGTTSHTAASGVATFSNLSIDKSGAGYTLAATASGLTGATSSGFAVSADGVDAGLSTLASSADTVGQCTASCSPAFQTSTVTVTVKDQFGNRIAGSPVVVSANGTGNVFAPSGSGTTDANGTFTTAYNASVAENKTLSATAGGIGLSQTPGIAVMPVLVGAGDIADCNSIGDDATANQLDNIPGVVFAAGDNAYSNGTATNFTDCYDPTWGRHKARTRPVVGNHEYDSSGTAAPYFTYFGAATADPQGNGFGYYSYDLGAWHIVVLNSDSGVTSPSSNQLTWLQSDLAGRTNQCVLALWHRPLFTSGSSGGAGTRVRRLWQALENAGAEVVINGHDHLYERFAPQDSLGNANSSGIREFIVGTGGGEAHSNFVSTPPNVEASDGPTKATFSRGVLRLTLYPNAYRWEFLAAQGFGTYSDSGSGTCH